MSTFLPLLHVRQCMCHQHYKVIVSNWSSLMVKTIEVDVSHWEEALCVVVEAAYME
jgi:hypothetical protein